jgi:hypothetical protein
MQTFFVNNTGLSRLTFCLRQQSEFDDSAETENGRRRPLIDFPALPSWTNRSLQCFLWRQCYSFILCSTIAFVEDAFSELERVCKTGDNVNGQSMALTGVQGTGKSILGPIIALVMAKAFGWCVFYSWGDETISIGGDANSNKRISIEDLSLRKAGPSLERFTLLVTSANTNERWHDTVQQGVVVRSVWQL